MAELENMPNVHEIASWCHFEESDDLAGLLHSLPKRQPKAASSRPSPRGSQSRQFRTGDIPSPVLQATARIRVISHSPEDVVSLLPVLEISGRKIGATTVPKE